jgi:nucleoside-diphosphate-sugar epimerase
MSNPSAEPLQKPVLVTGASGFVGRELCRTLEAAGVPLRAALRTRSARPGTGLAAWTQAAVDVGDIGPETDWSAAVAGCMAVVHLAARVHIMREHSSDPLTEFRRVNRVGTRRLAEAAAAAGVRRFVFMSTVKVHGEVSPGRPFVEGDPLVPADAYSISKSEAEQELAEVCSKTGMQLTILRPPLVYGPGVGGNFARLLRSVDRGLPLPFGAFHNRRSLVYVGNLADAVAACITEHAAASGAFLVGDGESVSTPDLVRRIAAALERPARLVNVPLWLLRAGANILGRSGDFDRLAGDLEVDSGAIRRALQWKPRVSMPQGLAATAQWYRSAR